MKFEKTSVYNFENAIRGMRLPMQSHDKSDSKFWDLDIEIGENDLDLMQRLIKGETPHDKFMRQIFVSVDITAPLYLWKELDQYKVGTTTNSQSTMHKLATTDDFADDLLVYDDYACFEIWEEMINHCETLRKRYLETKDKKYWKELIRILPESWLQTRTWTANYEVLRNIVHQRQGHKLTEWQSFIGWVKTLPYAEELIFYGEERDEL